MFVHLDSFKTVKVFFAQSLEILTAIKFSAGTLTSAKLPLLFLFVCFHPQHPRITTAGKSKGSLSLTTKLKQDIAASKLLFMDSVTVFQYSVYIKSHPNARSYEVGIARSNL